MTTFREIVHMCLDLLKETSDDAFYTEEHILFLVKKMRGLLLDKKYRGSRNTPFVPVSEENKQRVCFNVDIAEDLSGGCDGVWLKSQVQIPELMQYDNATTCTVNDMLNTAVTFIPKERMPYVGHNKFLQNIIYAARSIDGYVYLKGFTHQFQFLTKAGITGVFADPEAAAKANICNGGSECSDIMDERFPLEEALISPCIELVVQELSGARFAPKDNRNDDKDNLPEAVGARQSQQQKSAE